MNEIKCRLYHDNFQNYKRYNIPKAQLVIADIPYNLGVKAYASNPMWYNGGDNKNGESKFAAASFFSGKRSCCDSREKSCERMGRFNMKEKTLRYELLRLGRGVLVILRADILWLRVNVLRLLSEKYKRRYIRYLKKSIRCHEAALVLLDREETILNAYTERDGER